MTPHLQTDHTSASSAAPCVGPVRLDSGALPGLVVVDSNRPASLAGIAGGLLKQFVTAH